MKTDDTLGLWKYAVGIACGIGLTYGYVRFGFTLPGIVQLGGTVASEIVITPAESDLYNPHVTHEVRQRALAVIVGRDPELFIEIDSAIDHRFFEEVLRRKAVRKAKLLKQRMSAYRIALAKPALRDMYARKFGTDDTEILKHKMLIRDIQDDDFLSGYLRRRFPKASPDELAGRVLDVYHNEFKPPGRADTATAVKSDRTLQ